jgi:dCTP deaminase
MAYLGTEKLKDLIRIHNVVDPVDYKRVICGAYELSLGNEVFRTDSKDKKKEFLTQSKEQISINPGQFALLLSLESVNVPTDKIAFISIKAGIKLKGLINVSGFHVDPGFKGNLVFSVYNAGTSPISLLKGEPCFLIWFAELDLVTNETSSYEKGSHEHKNQDTIPTKYIDALIGGELASPNVLSKRIDEVRNLKTKIEWAVLAGLTLLIGLSVKLWLDLSKLRDAIDYGYKKKTEEMISDSTFKKTQYDINALSIRLDSLMKVAKSKTEQKHQGHVKH